MKNRWIQQIFRQLLVAVVMFSLILPGSLMAKREKPGANLIVTKTSGKEMKGELLKVEGDSLLLLDFESLNKVSIGVHEIGKIRIKKKGSFWKGAVIGFLTGIVGTALLVGIAAIKSDIGFFGGAYLGLIVGTFSVGPLSGLAGGMVSATSSKGYKTFQMGGKNKFQKEWILKKLEKKARFKN